MDGIISIWILLVIVGSLGMVGVGYTIAYFYLEYKKKKKGSKKDA